MCRISPKLLDQGGAEDLEVGDSRCLHCWDDLRVVLPASLVLGGSCMARAAACAAACAAVAYKSACICLLQIKLHDGFYYFMGYCVPGSGGGLLCRRRRFQLLTRAKSQRRQRDGSEVLSVIGALLIDLPAEHNTARCVRAFCLSVSFSPTCSLKLEAVLIRTWDEYRIEATFSHMPASQKREGTQELPDVHDDGDSTASARPRSPAGSLDRG